VVSSVPLSNILFKVDMPAEGTGTAPPSADTDPGGRQSSDRHRTRAAGSRGRPNPKRRGALRQLCSGAASAAAGRWDSSASAGASAYRASRSVTTSSGSFLSLHHDSNLPLSWTGRPVQRRVGLALYAVSRLELRCRGPRLDRTRPVTSRERHTRDAQPCSSTSP
jgi:hypothetical protein